MPAERDPAHRMQRLLTPAPRAQRHRIAAAADMHQAAVVDMPVVVAAAADAAAAVVAESANTSLLKITANYTGNGGVFGLRRFALIAWCNRSSIMAR